MQFPSGDHPWPTVAEKGTLRNVGGCRVEWKQGMIRNVRPDREIHHMSAPPFIRPSLPPLLRILEAITFSACFVSSSSSSLLSLANYYRHKRVPFFFFFPQVFGTIVVIFSWFLFLDWTTRIIRWNLSYQSFKSDDTRLIQSTSRPTNLFRGATRLQALQPRKIRESPTIRAGTTMLFKHKWAVERGFLLPFFLLHLRKTNRERRLLFPLFSPSRPDSWMIIQRFLF